MRCLKNYECWTIFCTTLERCSWSCRGLLSPIPSGESFECVQNCPTWSQLVYSCSKQSTVSLLKLRNYWRSSFVTPAYHYNPHLFRGHFTWCHHVPIKKFSSSAKIVAIWDRATIPHLEYFQGWIFLRSEYFSGVNIFQIWIFFRGEYFQGEYF